MKIESNSNLNELIVFQDKFINLVHSEIYAAEKSNSQNILKFQLSYISDINDKYNQMVKELNEKLVQKKQGYNNILRSYFHKALNLDFLPLLRINRYELTQISLYGFDIYIEPLQAILEILNRIDRIQQIICQGLQFVMQDSAWSSLESNWEQYMCYCNIWKLQLNLYILKQYLKIGDKSLNRRDKQIIFTGAQNIFKKLIPFLLKHETSIPILIELSVLNNELYFFHPSYNYFTFYKLLLVQLEDKLQPVCRSIAEVAEKCMNTNIITPLLFGLMRHYQFFYQFIKKVNNKIWLPYLSGLITGLLINLKARILQYQQVMELLGECMHKCGLLGHLDVNQVIGQLPECWAQARDFFISALKIGYNVGELQTWHPINFQSIQPFVLDCVIDSMLLIPSITKQQILHFTSNLKQKLQSEILVLTVSKLSFENISNGINKYLFEYESINSLLRIINLIYILQNSNENILYFIMQTMIQLFFKQTICTQNSLKNSSKRINQMLLLLPIQNNLLTLKSIVISFHQLYLPQNNKQQLTKWYLRNLGIKKSINLLLIIWKSQDINQLFGILIHEYIRVPNEKITAVLTTFQKEYSLCSNYIVINNYTHNFLHVFTQSLVKQGHQYASLLLTSLVKVCPWISILILTFPVSIVEKRNNIDNNNKSIDNNNKISSNKQEQQLEAFSSWLIKHPQNHLILQKIIHLSSIICTNGNNCMKQIININISQQIINQINFLLQSERQNIQLIIKFIQLLLYVLLYCQENNITEIYSDLFIIVNKLVYNVNKQYLESILTLYLKLLYHSFGNNINECLEWYFFMNNALILQECHEQIVIKQINIKGFKNSTFFIQNDLSNQIDFEEKYNLEDINSKLKQEQKNCFVGINLIQQLFQERNASTKINQSYKKNNRMFKYQHLMIATLHPEQISYILQQAYSKEQESSKWKNFIEIIRLNPINNKICLEWSIKNKCTQMLQKIKYCTIMNDKLQQILKIVVQSQQNNFINWYNMTCHLNQNHKQYLSQSFSINTINITMFLKISKQSLFFLIVQNNCNWRQIMQYFYNKLSTFNILSILLQYQQYLIITNNIPNNDYIQVIKEYENFINCYSLMLHERIQWLILCKNQYSTQEYELKKNNQMANLNVLISKAQLKDVMPKLGKFNTLMRNKQMNMLQNILTSCTLINKDVNKLIGGHLMVPDFMYSFKLTCETVYLKHHNELSILLEQYYKQLGYSIQQAYIPDIAVLSFEQFINTDKLVYDSDQIKNTYIVQVQSGIKVENNIKKIIQNLQSIGILQFSSSIILNDQENCADKDIENILYKLGVLYKLLGTQKYQLSALIIQFSSRDVLDWEMLHTYYIELYHQIKAILADKNIHNKEMTFTKDDKQLIEGGNSIHINDSNKIQYCNLLALESITKQKIAYLKAICRGILYQQEINKAMINVF